MKVCRECGEEKSLTQFYKHKEMADGHLNKCKRCVKDRTLKRERNLRNNPEWIEKERARGREKYKRLNYRDMQREYKKAFPEKVSSHSKSSHIYKDGYEKHHWSYNEGDEKSVVFLLPSDHSKVHRFCRYDRERFMFRKCEDGILIDSIEALIDYIKHLEITDYEIYKR